MPEKDKKGEIWKDIPEYEGYYQASNMGGVRSLDRWVIYSNGGKRFFKGFLNPGCLNGGYKTVTLSKCGKCKVFRFSQLVAMAFLCHKPNGITMVVDHINGDKIDDRLVNLRVVTNRENCTTCFRTNSNTLSSSHVGVIWVSRDEIWRSKITYKGSQVIIGYYKDEKDASDSYQKALLKIKTNTFNPDDYAPVFSSKHKGVSFHKAAQKWQAYITINGKRKYLGLFPTELEAYQARLKAEQEINDGVFLLRREANKIDSKIF